MEQYIPKSALVAEIENKRKHAQAIGDVAINSSMQQFFDGMKQGCVDILSFIDTFKVKEVDLERLINDYFTGWYFDSELDILAKPNNYSATIDDVKEIAKHFFELGLKAQHSSINIPNIDDIFEENGIDPNSKDAKILKECYYMALERLKEEKEKEV